MTLKEDPTVYDLKEAIEDLQRQVFYLTALLKFHKLYEIPRKYKKFNPHPFEPPFFELKKDKEEPKFSVNADNSFSTLNELPDPQEIRASKNRMWECYKQSLTIPNPNLLSEILKKEYDPWPPFHKGD